RRDEHAADEAEHRSLPPPPEAELENAVDDDEQNEYADDDFHEPSILLSFFAQDKQQHDECGEDAARDPYAVERIATALFAHRHLVLLQHHAALSGRDVGRLHRPKLLPVSGRTLRRRLAGDVLLQ